MIQKLEKKTILAEVEHCVVDSLFFFVPGILCLLFSLLLITGSIDYYAAANGSLPNIMFFLFVATAIAYTIYFFARGKNYGYCLGGLPGPTPFATFGLIMEMTALFILVFCTSSLSWVRRTDYTFWGLWADVLVLIICIFGIVNYMECAWNKHRFLHVKTDPPATAAELRIFEDLVARDKEANVQFAALGGISIPAAGETGQEDMVRLDIVDINPYGIFVINSIDSKICAGTISGTAEDREWICRKREYQVTIPNPILQNQNRIAYLQRLLRANGFEHIPVYSIIVLEQGRAYPKVNCSSPNVKVVSEARVKKTVEALGRQTQCLLSDETIVALNKTLLPYHYATPALTFALMGVAQ